MQDIINLVAKSLQNLTDTELKNLGAQSFFIVNAYHNCDLENCYVYDAEIVNIGKFLENNFKIDEFEKVQLLLNKRGAILGFYKGQKDGYALVENYRCYLGNPVNSNFQYSTENLPKEIILLCAKTAQPLMLFETLIPQKDEFNRDILDDNGKTLYQLKEFDMMLKNEIEDYKQSIIIAMKEGGLFDERTLYRTRFVTLEEYDKITPKGAELNWWILDMK